MHYAYKTVTNDGLSVNCRQRRKLFIPKFQYTDREDEGQ
jgi:hypothetical protein